MAEGLDLGLSGLASGFDWRSLVDQLSEVERAPQRRMRSDQVAIQDRRGAYNSIATQFAVLQNRMKALSETALFDSRLAQSSNEDIVTALSESGAALGSYAFHIIQLATASVRRGTANIASPLHATNDVSGVVLGNAPVATAITAGTFTVNGQAVTIATTDTLQAVFDKINTATGGDVTGSYDPNADRITLTSASNAEIVLGSATDTSNLLQALRLSNNGTGTVTSSSALGSAKLSGALSAANLATAITDGGSGAGKFKINGVEITFNAATDSLSTVLQRINDSTAGVTASYDAVNDRFLLTNKVTGDLGVALEDVTGNFLAATGLSAGALERGQDLLYTVNGGGQLSSHSNVITEASSGLEGLSVTALDTGDATVTVGSDSATIKKAITDFIDEYNKAQALIDTNTASSTDANGVVTAGTLAGESDAYTMAGELRRLVTPTFSFLTGALQRLESLGITSNGDNDQLVLSDSARLETALASHLGEVKSLFTHSTQGLAVTLEAYLEKAVGDEGTLTTKQNNLDKQVSALTEQMSEQERLVQLRRQQLITSFIAMETAQQRINQQLQFLSRINGSAA
jgi:flagellar hook-associated protein 2